MADRISDAHFEPKPERYYAGSRTPLIDFYLQHRGVGGRALDVGCGAGTLGAELLRRGFSEAHGVEPVPHVAQLAAEQLTSVINSVFPSEQLEGLGRFDLIVFADSLEHMLDPWTALRTAATMLETGGALLLSVPNVSHWSVIRQLLEGRWDYVDEGLLDRTHVRFFTPATLRELLESTGFRLVAEQGMRGSIDDPSAKVSLQRTIADRAAFWFSLLFNPFLPVCSPRIERFLERFWPHTLVYQQYVVAVKENK